MFFGSMVLVSRASTRSLRAFADEIGIKGLPAGNLIGQQVSAIVISLRYQRAHESPVAPTIEPPIADIAAIIVESMIDLRKRFPSARCGGSAFASTTPLTSSPIEPTVRLKKRKPL